MTAEELIIGHYDQSLSSEQERQLSSMLDSSPEIRTLYDQHGRIHTLMASEAETITTSSKLDRVVVGAALGALAEIGGHGLGFSLAAKIAAAVSTVAVGGLSVFLLTGGGSDADDVPARTANPPAVQSTTSTGTPAEAAPGAIEASPATAGDPAVDQSGEPRVAPTPNGSSPSGQPIGTTQPRTTAERDRAAARERDGRSGSSQNPPALDLGDSEQVTIENPTPRVNSPSPPDTPRR